MANEKFEPQGQITDVEIKLECLRLATEFGPEFERKDPLEKLRKEGFHSFLIILNYLYYIFIISCSCCHLYIGMCCVYHTI